MGARGADPTMGTDGFEGVDGSTEDIVAGTMIGEYQVEGLLGEGGMGKVYSAVHPVIAKRAAVKVLHPMLSMNREAVERFVLEARSVNQIGHPNIVDIFAFGTMADGRSYFVMEWLRGESLRDRVRRAWLPLTESLAILDTVTVALEAAHEKGIVHRDLKPDNVFLVEVKGSAPQVKLLDFGIAKLVGGDNNALSERTRTGNLLGTPAYMSPEQARGIGVDHRTDIYAFGALAFELLTGRLPFPATNAADMIGKHLYEPPPLAHEHNVELPPEVGALVAALLAKEPDQRPTLAFARDELRRFRTHAAYALMAGTGPTMFPGAATDPQATPPSMLGRASQPHMTPPPGMLGRASQPVIATPPGGVPVVPPPRSRGLVIAVVALLVAAGGIAAFVVAGGGKHDTASSATTSVPVEVPPAPAPSVDPKPAVVEAPVVAPAPVDPKPAVVEAPVPVPAPVPTPVIDTKPPVDPVAGPKTKPVIKKPIIKKPGVKKPDDDDNAPM